MMLALHALGFLCLLVPSAVLGDCSVQVTPETFTPQIVGIKNLCDSSLPVNYYYYFTLQISEDLAGYWVTAITVMI